MTSSIAMKRPVNKKKRIVGTLAAAGIAAGLAGGAAGTYSLWSDGTDGFGGGNIATGNLDYATLGQAAVSDQIGTIDLATYKAVPGDTVTFVQPMDVALEGKNMAATFVVNAGKTAVANTNFTVAYTVKDEAGKVVVPETALGGAQTVVNLTPADVTAALDTKADYNVTTVVKFKEGTSNRVDVQKTFTEATKTMSVSLDQVAPASSNADVSNELPKTLNN